MTVFRVNYILICSFFSKAGSLIPSGVPLPTSIQAQNKLYIEHKHVIVQNIKSK